MPANKLTTASSLCWWQARTSSSVGKGEGVIGSTTTALCMICLKARLEVDYA